MYSEQNLVKRLQSVTHFRNLTPKDIWTIVTAGKVHRYSKDSIIYREGEPVAGLYVIFKGRVHLCKVTPQGHEYIVGLIDPVIMFNEVASLDGGPNPVTAVACEDSVVWHVSYESFQRLLKQYPILGLSLLKVLATRNRDLIMRYEDLTCRTVIARAARFLLNLSECGQKPINRRDHPNRVLAARAATGPEQFSRSIKTLQEDGLITCNRSWIHVIKPDALAKLAQVIGNIKDFDPDQAGLSVSRDNPASIR